jgi:hypothetical protein
MFTALIGNIWFYVVVGSLATVFAALGAYKMGRRRAAPPRVHLPDEYARGQTASSSY